MKTYYYSYFVKVYLYHLIFNSNTDFYFDRYKHFLIINYLKFDLYFYFDFFQIQIFLIFINLSNHFSFQKIIQNDQRFALKQEYFFKLPICHNLFEVRLTLELLRIHFQHLFKSPFYLLKHRCVLEQLFLCSLRDLAVQIHWFPRSKEYLILLEPNINRFQIIKNLKFLTFLSFLLYVEYKILQKFLDPK